MKDKPYYFPFNDYVKIFEEITCCQINPEKTLIAKRLERFLKKFNITPDNVEFAERVIKSDNRYLNSFLDIFIPVESFFFREQDYLDLTLQLIKKHSLKNVLVAPCAGGETVYSLKILAEEKNIKNNIFITGLDISERAIEKAQRGIYNEYSLNKADYKIKNKYFRVQNNKYIINNELKRDASFITANLATFKAYRKYDIILCRNLLIYLREASIKLILKRICKMLKNNGFLILGKSDLPFMKNETNFYKVELNNLVYFRKKLWLNC